MLNHALIIIQGSQHLFCRWSLFNLSSQNIFKGANDINVVLFMCLMSKLDTDFSAACKHQTYMEKVALLSSCFQRFQLQDIWDPEGPLCI